MAPIGRREEKSIKKSNAKKKLRNEISKVRPTPEELKGTFGMIRFRLTSCRRAPDQSDCSICGVFSHLEHFCPYNYIYGRYGYQTCRGQCTPGPEQHRITSRSHRKFLCCFIRVTNLPPGFREWHFKELFSPFGPLLMWDVPRFISKTCSCESIICMSFAVVVFKKREDGARAIEELNGYEAGGCKLRIDWVYPSYLILKERTALQAGADRRLVVSHLPKFRRFFSLQEMLRKIKEEEQEKEQQEIALMKEPADEGCATVFWRDHDATFCSICGDDKGKHSELKCPYNYLSPTTYSPCKARLALWGNYTTTLRFKCSRHKQEQREPPVHDETNSRRLEFLRCFVRVNNLPERCRPEELATLFTRFGPLRMWHVATRKSGVCKGFGCIVFQNRDQADEAIEALNCRDFGGRKLRVDWAYPCLNC